MRDIPLPNGVVICDGRGLFGSPPATGAKLDGSVIMSRKADGRDGGEVVSGMGEVLIAGEVVSGEGEVVSGEGAMVAGVGAVVSGEGAVV